MNSIHTNAVAFNALRTLSEANDKLERSTGRLSSGNRVATAVDDGGAFTVAQGLRGDLKAHASVDQQLAQGQGLLDVSLAAGTLISDTLQQARAALVRLGDPALTVEDRARAEVAFTSRITEMQGYRDNAAYNGSNLLDGSIAPPGVNLLSNIDGSMTLIPAPDLSTIIDGLLPPPADAPAAVALLDGTNPAFATAETTVATALNTLGTVAKRVETLRVFNEAVRDATQAGLGSVVDADLARETAVLEALQTRQQLITQSLSIVNQSPQALLGLFNGG